MDKYDITGMSCAACSARVEKAVSAVPGVTSCSVSLLTNSMGVEGTADPKAIIKAVTDAGYGASPAGGSASDDAPADKLTLENEREKSVLKRRLVLSVAFLLALMYFSMGHMMWNFPAPKVFDNPVFLGIFEMLLSGLILIINSAFFTSGFRSLFKGGPNMNTLVALGSSVAFGFSLVELFLMADALWTGDHMRAMELGDNLYFESAAMIPTLITVGKLLEAISKGRTTDALKGLMKLTPKTATVLRNGSELTIPAAEV
ncbi:MAG: cation-translocating P-type ATPase, partial [Lachnospiraceae bacterium]|nr:cation-translocating P-type ATPase [Lachnospiraceae bacterium]